MLPRYLVRFVSLICSLCVMMAKPMPQGLCGSDSYTRRSEERYFYQQAQLKRFAATGSILSLAADPVRADAGVTDVGDIAVVDDSDGVRVRRNPFNLQLKKLAFIPTGSGKYRVESSNGDFDTGAANAGEVLAGLGDDDTREVVLPFEFPFYGKTHRSMFVNSDGNVSFEAGDSASSDRSLSRMAAGPPRISGLFADLDPTASPSGVHVLAESQRVVVSWIEVPFYGLNRRQNFQVILYSTGNVEIIYGDTNIFSDDVVVGIAPGRLANETRIVTLGLGANGEEFAGGIAEIFAGTETYDVTRAIQRFYATHDDVYDNLFVFNAMGMNPALCPTAIACTDVIRNHATGYGRELIDDGSIYGSPKRLEAVIDMGPWEGYPDNPFQEHPLRPATNDTGLNIFGHEASHRFLAWVSPKDDFGRDILLGRQGAHWNFNFNSEGSLVEGNRLIDRGTDVLPRFLSAGAGERIAPLDQYFFGWRAAEEVPPTFVVLNSNVTNTSTPPRPGALISGTRRDVTVEEMIAEAGGPRVPDYQIAPRKYRWGILIITREGQPIPTAAIEKLERYRVELPAFWSKVSEGRSELEVTFKRSLDVSVVPHAEYVQGVAVDVSISLRYPAEADLRCTIESGDGSIVEVPAEVVIPAGQTSAAFQVRAVSPGVQLLKFRPADERYEAVESRIRVTAPPPQDPVE
jgi:hypothetical protein